MNEEKNKSRQTVSSVGNSWIVSQSKSHPGFVYYFNTTTGEAVWNLSDGEIAKARMRTNLLEDKLGSKPTACPEPKDNPPLFIELTKKLNNIKRQQKQQSEMNIFQQQQLEFPQRQPEVKILQTQQQTASVFTEVPGNLPHFDLNALNNQISSFNGINTPNVFNGAPNGQWAIPQTQQFFIRPTIPFVNPAQNLMNVEYDQGIRNNAAATSRFNHFQNLPNRRKTFYHPNKKFGRGGQKNVNMFHLSNNNNDLRQRILSRRNEETHSKNEGAFNNNTQTADVTAHIVDMIGEDFTEHKKRDSVEKTIEKSQPEEKPVHLDLTPLKRLAPFDANPDIWYIVVDLNVLLHEYKFLTTMTDSDQECHLLIPDQVITDLKDYIARSNNIPARLMFHSLSQKFETGVAVKAGEPNQDYGEAFTNNILKTCLEIFEENFHVVLITNDSEMLSYKKFIKIKMFTVDDVKLLIEGCPYETPKNNMPAFMPRKSIINNSSQNAKIICDVGTRGERIVSELTQQEHSQTTTTVQPLKRSVDASIQTDVPIVVICDSQIEDQKPYFLELNQNSDKINTGPVKNLQDAFGSTNKALRNSESILNDSNKAKSIHESLDKGESNQLWYDKSEHTHEFSNNPTVTANCNLPKRREIKLKRSVSNLPQNNVGKGNEKKPFRWRRKRDMCCQATETVNSYVCANPQADVPSAPNTVSNFEEQEVGEKSDDRFRSEQNSDYGEINCSRDSSVICMSTKRHYITIEETSTSGNISNTESNVDAESVNNIHNKTGDSCDEHKEVVMYEIEDEVMAESLATKCEEWVSRFVQIMEEVLTEVLHKKQFSITELPPPWTLHEAAQCIGKYSNNVVVKYVTDKLSTVLFNISDTSGKLSMFMSPCQFMELFSYGVSLLHAIKNIASCEEIEIAEESLQALLRDIKNPDCDSDDSVIDPYETGDNLQVSGITNEYSDVSSAIENVSNTVEENTSKFNLRSKTRPVEEETMSSQSLRTRQQIQLPHSVRTPEQIQLPQSVRAPERIQSPRSVRTCQQIQSPQSVRTPERIQSPRSVRTRQQIQTPQSVRTPERIQSPKSERKSERIHSPKSVRKPERIQSPKSVRKPERIQSPQSVRTRQQIQSSQSVRTPERIQSPRLVTQQINSPRLVRTPQPIRSSRLVKTSQEIQSPVKTSEQVKSPPTGRTPQEINSPPPVKTPEELKTPLPASSPQLDTSPPPVNLPQHVKPSPQPVKVVRNIDIPANFFTTLKLKSPVSNKTNISPSHSLNAPEKKTSDSQKRPNKSNYVTFSSGYNENTSATTVNAPTVVRNFTLCAEFEAKLKKKNAMTVFDDQEEYLDYEHMDEDDYLYNSEDYQSGDCLGSEEEEEMTKRSDPKITKLLDKSDIDMAGRNAASSPKAVDPSLPCDSNKKFKFMMCMFLQEVHKAINEVKVLCDKCYAELEKPQLSGIERNLLLKQAENANLHIVGLCISLQSMLDRNHNAPTDNIQTAMKKAGIELTQIDEHLLTEYWDTVANCKKHADVFLLSIREIVEAFKSTDI